MNKNHFAASAAMVVALGLPLAAPVQAQQPITVTVDGNVVAFGAQQPVEQFGTVLVPLRGVFEKLGANVAYDSASKSILAVRGNTTVSLKLGSREAQVNNETRTLSVPAQAVNGSTLVPLRFVSESLGAYVGWQAASRTVVVSTGGNGAPPVATNPPPVRPPRGDDRFIYGRIAFDWDANGFTVRDRPGVEAQIREALNTDPGSRFVRRRPNSDGTLEVNVTLKRINNLVRADVRLGLNQNGQGGSAVTATESATAPFRGNSVNDQVVMQAFRKARREFATKVNQFARDNR